MAQVSVIGPSRPDKSVYHLAYNIGKIIGKHGYTLITGGRGGVMEAASCGAKENGGITVGILPEGMGMANRCVDIKIPTYMNEVRNFIVIYSGDIIVSVGISDGTLTELTIARKLKKPVISFMLPENLHFLATHVLNKEDLPEFEKILLRYAP